MSHRLRIDPIRCDGYGLCAGVVPELISLDDWGYPLIAPGSVPAHLLADARRAIDACPVLALRLQQTVQDGTHRSGASQASAALPAPQPGRARIRAA